MACREARGHNAASSRSFAGRESRLIAASRRNACDFVACGSVWTSRTGSRDRV